MRILFLSGGEISGGVLETLQKFDDVIESATTLDQAEEALSEEVDWIVSAGFRHIVPVNLLERAGDTCNVHISYLPWGRGANPNVWAIADAEPAGVTIHQMLAGVDAGPVFAQKRVSTSFGDLAPDLYQRLLEAATQLFSEIWPKMRQGDINPIPQLEGGSFHRISDMQALGQIDLEERVTWRRAINILRALTFPPHRNVVVQEAGRRFHVEIRVHEITGED